MLRCSNPVDGLKPGIQISAIFTDHVHTSYPAQTYLFHSHFPFDIEDIRTVFGFDASPISSDNVMIERGFMYGKSEVPSSVFARRLSFIRNLRALFTDWNFGDMDVHPQDDTPIIHINPVGSLIVNDYNSLRLYSGNPLFYDQEVVERFTGIKASISEMYPTISLIEDADDFGIIGSINDWAPTVAQYSPSGAYDADTPSGWQYIRQPYFSHRKINAMHSIVFGWYARTNANIVYVDVYRYQVKLVPIIPSPKLLLDTNYDLNTLFNVTIKLSTRSLWSSSGSPSIDYWVTYGQPFVGTIDPYAEDDNSSWQSIYWYTANLVATSKPGSYGIEPFIGRYNGILQDTGETTIKRFITNTTCYLEDIYPMSFFSSKDALDTMFETSKANYLETLAEFRDCLGLFSAVNIMKLIHLISVGKGGISMLLDMLSDLSLLYSFGIRPLISDSVELQSILKHRTHSIHDKIMRYGTYYGQYNFEVPNTDDPEAPFGGVARSKLRIRIHPDSYWQHILPLASYGLLPSLSNIWDLIPYSFIIDYFAKIDDKLEWADASMIMLALTTAESFHSVAIEHSFNVEELSNHGLAPDGTMPNVDLLYRYYERFHLSMVPPVMPTRLIGFSDITFPSWTVTSGLLYKFLF